MPALDLISQLKKHLGARVDPDLDLVHAAMRGDQRAFDRLAQAHQERLRGFISRRVGPEVVDDLLQDSFLAAWTSLPRFQGRSSFKAWLYGIAVHKCDDYFRSRGRSVIEVPLPEDGGPWASPEELYAAAELRESIRQVLAELPHQQREVIELYYYAELTLAEIAGVLERNLNTVKYQFYRAHTLVESGIQKLALVPPHSRGPEVTSRK